MAYSPAMATVRSNSGPDETNEQRVPKPDWYEGNDVDSWVLTGHDGRLASEPGAGSFKTIEDVRAMRNLREIDKH